MGNRRDTQGATQGAFVVLFGMLIGALLVLTVQRYATLEKQRVLKEAYTFHGKPQ